MALPLCMTCVAQGPWFLSQVFQVKTNRHCRNPKQDVAAKQGSLGSKNEFSPSLSEARGEKTCREKAALFVRTVPWYHDTIPRSFLCLFLNWQNHRSTVRYDLQRFASLTAWLAIDELTRIYFTPAVINASASQRWQGAGDILTKQTEW